MDMDGVRTAIAEAVTAAGMACTPYPADSPTPPVAWVDTASLDYQSGASFCMQAEGTITVVTSAQRNDRAGGMKVLEALIPAVTQEVEALGPVRTISVESGSTQLGGVDVPAVLYVFQAAITS